MKKVLFVLAALLITTPAMAIVNVTCTDEGSGVCRIDYDFSSGETEKLRGIALTISVDAGQITAISDFKVGESGQSNKTGDPVKGYGIFPANFGRYITDPCSPDWGVSGYTPAAEAGDKGAPTGIPSAAIVVELGSLYDPTIPANAPDATGTLCKITVSENCTVTIDAEETYRGGVVMEDSNPPAGGDNMPSQCTMTLECFPSDHPDYGEWTLDYVGKPDCWCIPRHCYGDVDGALEGSVLLGYSYVSTNDLNVLSGVWRTLEPEERCPSFMPGVTPVGPGIETVSAMGIAGICADVAHDLEGSVLLGYSRVSTNDLNKISNNWRTLEPEENCPSFMPGVTPVGPGIPGDCLVGPPYPDP
jgi:hypothetical protein